jgi:hypothetical protein
MTRSLVISQRQAQILLRAAAAERGIVEVQFGTAVVRLIPPSLVTPEAPSGDSLNPDAFETLAEYKAWRNRHAGGN